MSSAEPMRRAYELLIDEDVSTGELPRDAAEQLAGNAAKQVVAQTLQKVGDLVVDAKTVLSWLLAAIGAPASLVGLLVPIRESGSMLPQAALAPWVRGRRVRKWVWVGGGLLQALATLGMAVIAATARGTAAGVGILGMLALFALARSLSSITSKDVLGRTVPKGARGRITGIATVGGGIAAITVGLGMRLVGGQDTPPSTFAALLAGAAVAWVLAASTFATVREDPEEPEPGDRQGSGALALLRNDRAFRRFVVARTLLLVSALSPPFVVALASRVGGTGLSGLGAFVISSGVASLVGGRLWGGFADRSSRLTMVAAAASGSGVVLAFLLVLRLGEAAQLTWLYPMVYLLLALAHTGARVGRKTYVIDLAEGDRRTQYVAVSNTAMGVLLLITGAVTSAVALFGVELALLLLAVLGLVGVAVSRSLPEVSSSS